MATKLYFRVDFATDLGTSPPATKRTGLTVDAYMGSAETLNLACEETAGPAQDFNAGSSVGTTATQRMYGQRFFSPPLAAQTIGGSSQTITINVANEESNTSMNFGTAIRVHVSVWRPSTNSFLGAGASADFINAATITSGLAEPASAGTERVNHGTLTFTPNSFTVQAGDRLCIELIWEFTQAMSASYTGTFYYDGTTENTTTNATVTNHASFIQFSDTITFDSGPTVNSGALDSDSAASLTGNGSSTAASSFDTDATAGVVAAGASTVGATFDLDGTAALSCTGASIQVEAAALDSGSAADLTGSSASVLGAVLSSDSTALTTVEGASVAATGFGPNAAASLAAAGGSDVTSDLAGSVTAAAVFSGEGQSPDVAAGEAYVEASASLNAVGDSVASAFIDSDIDSLATLRWEGEAAGGVAAASVEFSASTTLTFAPAPEVSQNLDGFRRRKQMQRNLQAQEEEELMLLAAFAVQYLYEQSPHGGG